MTVTAETATAISSSLVRVTKLLHGMRAQMPVQRLLEGLGGPSLQGLDHSHVPALFVVSQEPHRVSALAEAVHSDVSTVSRQVSHLTALGLVEKIGDPADGRAQMVTLTAEGRRVIDELIARRGEWFAHLLKGWSEEEAETFLQHLDRFSADIAEFRAELASHPGQHPGGETGAQHTTSTTETGQRRPLVPAHPHHHQEP